MRRETSVPALVYRHLFPKPRPEDPQNFAQHLSKNLVGEVRIETATFYGSLDTIEARYPGLNYSHAPHRKRLGRFTHHARLFKAFDELGLTESEIASMCRWEGTLWARQRYEQDEGIKVRDTTGDDIGPWVDHHRAQRKNVGIKVKTDIEVEIEEVRPTADAQDQTMMDDMDEDEDTDEDDPQDDAEESEEEPESVGYELNQRLIQAAATREQGVNAPLDPEWEQFLKEQSELDERQRERSLRAMTRLQDPSRLPREVPFLRDGRRPTYAELVNQILEENLPDNQPPPAAPPADPSVH